MGWHVRGTPFASLSPAPPIFRLVRFATKPSLGPAPYTRPGVGRVKMTVGVKRSDKSKVQYCITAIDTGKIKQETK